MGARLGRGAGQLYSTLPCSLVAVAREPEREREREHVPAGDPFPIALGDTGDSAAWVRENQGSFNLCLRPAGLLHILTSPSFSRFSRLTYHSHTPPSLSWFPPSFLSLTPTLFYHSSSPARCVFSLSALRLVSSLVFVLLHFLLFFYFASRLACFLACSRSRPTVCLRWTWMV